MAALMIFAAWYVAANRCIFGLMPKFEPSVSASCCQQSQHTPVKAPVVPGHICCKSLQLGQDFSKSPIQLPERYFSEAITFILFSATPPSGISVGVLELDTGPPGGTTFSELVLSRSLQSHAPPALG
jgi:hypothetical protein